MVAALGSKMVVSSGLELGALTENSREILGSDYFYDVDLITI